MEAKHFKVSGKVQGVFFRKYTKIEADKLHICGWIRNDESGDFVEGECYGAQADMQLFERYLHTGPKKARVVAVELSPSDYRYTSFEIRY